MNKSLKTILLIIQIGGGLLGLGLIGRSILTEQITQTAVIIHIAFSLVFLFGIIAGVTLASKPKLGLRLSAVFQAIQIPVLIAPMAAYALFSGACLNLYRHGTGYGFNFLFGSRYYFSIHNNESWLVGVNVIALVLFILLVREIRLQSVFVNISKPGSSSGQQSQQYMHAQDHQTCGSPLHHILR